ncbi:hypothetical protein [Mumia sp. DW29H23]|uniref:hypothetical protein n=1 Tax=Mumia sp. DW29H23 TaxID=3421241 RepID=UPI003D68F1D6
MRTAVMRVVVDAEGCLSATEWENGVERLRASGREVVATPARSLPSSRREVELVVEGFEPADAESYVQECARAFGTTASPGVVTYVSRGTDDDARGVLEAFGISAKVERILDDEDEIVAVTLDALDLRRVPESRLHTALEAALNCEVRIGVAG